MKDFKRWIGLLAALAALVFSGLAIAGHGHGGGGHSGSGSGSGHGGDGHGHGGPHFYPGAFFAFGLGAAYLGGPWYWNAYDTWPFYDDYYYSSAGVASALSPAYDERDAPAVSPQQGEPSWYYCDNPPGYYPYVQNCPAGWQRVRPQAPPGRY
jgi:hypothetical protein